MTDKPIVDSCSVRAWAATTSNGNGARHWALQQAIGAIWYYIDSNPPMHRMGRRALEQIIADESHT